MDYSNIKEVIVEEDKALVNKMLSNGWVLLNVEKNSIMYGAASTSIFVLGRVNDAETQMKNTPQSPWELRLWECDVLNL